MTDESLFRRSKCFLIFSSARFHFSSFREQFSFIDTEQWKLKPHFSCGSKSAKQKLEVCFSSHPDSLIIYRHFLFSPSISMNGFACVGVKRFRTLLWVERLPHLRKFTSRLVHQHQDTQSGSGVEHYLYVSGIRSFSGNADKRKLVNTSTLMCVWNIKNLLRKKRFMAFCGMPHSLDLNEKYMSYVSPDLSNIRHDLNIYL